MENCKYNGEEICSFDLKDEWGIYEQNKVVELKRAAAQGYLHCTDCNERVYLAAGLIREPYFAHYDAKSCPYGKSQESEESRIGKRLIYHMLKDSFPEEDIKVRHRLEDGTFTSFYLETDEKYKLAIDYRLTQLPIKLLDKRKQYFLDHEIMPIFMLGIRQDKDQEQLNWYQQCVQELLGYCIFFDAVTATITLKRSFDYQIDQLRSNQVFHESYEIHDLKLTLHGFDCSFLEECYKKEEAIKRSLNEQNEKQKQEQLRQELYYQQQMKLEQKAEIAKQSEYLSKIIARVDFHETELTKGIRRDILLNCIQLILQGEVDLVSQKYIDYILKFRI